MKLHSPVTRITLLGALILAVAGCSTIKPTEDHLKTLSETNLGEPVKRISNVRSDSMSTYYVPSGASGGAFAIASFGLMKPATSTRYTR